MTIPKALDRIADLSEILTALLAFWAWVYYRWSLRRKRQILESHLKEERHRDGGRRTILHIIAQTGLTESEIIQSSFRSKVIKRHQQLQEGQTAKILFEYDPDK